MTNLNRNCITFHVIKQGTRSAEIRTLTSVFEKSVAASKPNLFRCKHIINTANLNVTTLNQQPELTASAVENKIDIICVQEYRNHYSELELKYHDTSSGWIFVLVSMRKNVAMGGEGMLLSPRA